MRHSGFAVAAAVAAAVVAVASPGPGSAVVGARHLGEGRNAWLEGRRPVVEGSAAVVAGRSTMAGVGRFARLEGARSTAVVAGRLVVLLCISFHPAHDMIKRCRHSRG